MNKLKSISFLISTVIIFTACEKENLSTSTATNKSAVEQNNSNMKVSDPSDNQSDESQFEYYLDLLGNEQYLSVDLVDGTYFYSIMEGHPTPDPDDDPTPDLKFPYNTAAGRKAAFEYALSLPCGYNALIVDDGANIEITAKPC